MCTSGWALVAVFLEVKREDMFGTVSDDCCFW